MSYGEIYLLVTDAMGKAFPWFIDCVNKFDATNVTSQSNMLAAIKMKAYDFDAEVQPEAEAPVEAETTPKLEGDDEIVL